MMQAARRLTLLHTNDIHSHFEMMSPVSAVLAEARKAAGDEPVVVLDIGDHMDRAAVETEGSMGLANIDILNLTGYDAVTLGNNEGLTFPADVLETAYASLHCPAVCCNLVLAGSGERPGWLKPRLVIERGGIRIGITGATAAFAPFYALLGWTALDPEEALREQCRLLAKESDIVVVLSHLGLPADELLAARLDGVHAILGGHTHHVLEQPLLIGGTAVCGAGKFGRYVGRVVFERSGEDGRFRFAEGGLLPVDAALVDPPVAAAVAVHFEHGRETLEETVAVTDRELPVGWQGESSFANLLAQAVRIFTGAELSLVNSGQLLGSLPRGNVTAGMLHGLCPSPINPCLMLLSGADIRLAAEQSLTEVYWNRPIFGYGFRGKVLGSLAIDGMTVRYEEQPGGDLSIREIRVGGLPLDDRRLYRVGTLDMFTFGSGYESIAHGSQVEYLLPHFLRDLLRMELQRPGSLDEADRRRWTPVRSGSG